MDLWYLDVRYSIGDWQGMGAQLYLRILTFFAYTEPAARLLRPVGGRVRLPSAPCNKGVGDVGTGPRTEQNRACGCASTYKNLATVLQTTIIAVN